MKLILDVEPQDYIFAVDISLRTMRDFPDMKVDDIVVYENDGQIFEVIRNQDSYTVDMKGQ